MTENIPYAVDFMEFIRGWEAFVAEGHSQDYRNKVSSACNILRGQRSVTIGAESGEEAFLTAMEAALGERIVQDSMLENYTRMARAAYIRDRETGNGVPGYVTIDREAVTDELTDHFNERDLEMTLGEFLSTHTIRPEMGRISQAAISNALELPGLDRRDILREKYGHLPVGVLLGIYEKTRASADKPDPGVEIAEPQAQMSLDMEAQKQLALGL